MKKRTYRKRTERRKTTGDVRLNDNRRERVIDPLARYGQLTTDRLVALYGSPYVKVIVKRLWHETAGLPAASHIMERPDGINRNVGSYLFHALGEGAYAHTRHDRAFLEKTKICKRSRYDHDNQIAMHIADIEATRRERFISHLAILDYPKCPPATWDKERPISFPVENGFIEPDALFGDELDKTKGADGYKFYAVELDNHTESLTVIRRKIENWNYVLDHRGYYTELGLPNLRIMWLTHSVTRERNIRALVDRHHEAHLFNIVPRYRLLDDPPPIDLSLFGSEWRTARGTTRLTGEGGEAIGHRAHQATHRAA